MEERAGQFADNLVLKVQLRGKRFYASIFDRDRNVSHNHKLLTFQT
jgi:hypothetical protein